MEEFRTELLALRAMPEANLEAPPEEEVEVLDQYLSASEQFIAAEEARKAQLAEKVGAGTVGDRKG